MTFRKDIQRDSLKSDKIYVKLSDPLHPIIARQVVELHQDYSGSRLAWAIYKYSLPFPCELPLSFGPITSPCHFPAFTHLD